MKVTMNRISGQAHQGIDDVTAGGAAAAAGSPAWDAAAGAGAPEEATASPAVRMTMITMMTKNAPQRCTISSPTLLSDLVKQIYDIPALRNTNTAIAFFNSSLCYYNDLHLSRQNKVTYH
jgi:hypothetical protein